MPVSYKHDILSAAKPVPMTSENTKLRLVYFADPMCSWCWGFSPVIETIRDQFADRIPIQMIIGGLNPGNRQTLSDKAKQEIKHHWLQVQQVSGQAFNFDFFQRNDFIYDTEPASLAVISCYRLQPDSYMAFMQHLQAAFYTRNLDITDDRILLQLAESFGLDPESFRLTLQQEETRRITYLGFSYARHLQVTGFPTLFGQTDEVNTVLTRGYQDLAPLTTKIENWLVSTGPKTQGAKSKLSTR